jgi:hypothetical protein
MKENPENKASRKRSIRESFPAPLNQIALSHVDSVQSLDKNWEAILAEALTKVGVTHLTACLAAIKNSAVSINTESDLLAFLHLSEASAEANSQDDNTDDTPAACNVDDNDSDYVASMLIKCYPDMPQATVERALTNLKGCGLNFRMALEEGFAVGEVAPRIFSGSR